jgi:hypothetical protein
MARMPWVPGVKAKRISYRTRRRESFCLYLLQARVKSSMQFIDRHLRRCCCASSSGRRVSLVSNESDS